MPKKTVKKTSQTAQKPKEPKKSKPKAVEWLSSYKLQMLTIMAASGLTMKALAKEIGITEPTLKKWRNENPEIEAAIKRGTTPLDDRMENELYMNAIDRYVAEDEIVYDYDANGQLIGERIVSRKYKHIKADTTAQLFWLCNRRPSVWRDIRAVAKTAETAEIESTGGVVILPEIADPPEENASEGEGTDNTGGADGK